MVYSGYYPFARSPPLFLLFMSKGGMFFET